MQNETDSNHCNPNQQHSSVAWNGILSLWVKFEHNFVFPKHSSCQIYAIYLCYTSNKPWRWSRNTIFPWYIYESYTPKYYRLPQWQTRKPHFLGTLYDNSFLNHFEPFMHANVTHFSNTFIAKTYKGRLSKVKRYTLPTIYLHSS